MSRTNVFFLPFAGGSIYSYTEFVKRAPDNIEIIPMDVPGRGTRFKESLLYRLEDMTKDVLSQLKARIQEPYIIFGHSMGTMIGYQLLHNLEKEGLPRPVHFFASGCSGPTRRMVQEAVHTLPKEAFINKLMELEGSPKEILENEGLMEIFEPILRADFEATSRFFSDKPNPVDVPITALTGADDLVQKDDAQAWGLETTNTFEIHVFPGKHFFIYDHVDEILRIISDTASAHQLSS